MGLYPLVNSLQVRSTLDFQHRMSYLFVFNKFIYLFLAVLGLCCCMRAFSRCSEQGLLFLMVCGLLIAVASLVAEQGLQVCGLQQLWCVGSRAQAQQLWRTGCGMWDLPGPGLEPMSPALAGGFLTTAPPGKSQNILIQW